MLLINPLASLLISCALADFNSDAQQAKSAADNLLNKVNGWSSKDGLLGALQIQNNFPPVSRAVLSLSKDVGSLQASDIDVSTVNAFASSISELLGALTKKAGDIKAVGATGIVGGDLDAIGNPAVHIVNGIEDILTADCDKLNSLTSALDLITNGFSSVLDAYGKSQLGFNPPPSC